jgi:Ribbon-helix-helix protein, copG family
VKDVTEEPESYYDDLAAWAASDAPTVRPDATIYRGDAARAASRALLEEATEDDAAGRELLRTATRGRPTLDPHAPTGESPLWQVRAPKSLDQALRDLAKSEGRSFSEVVRTAAAEYLATHRAS